MEYAGSGNKQADLARINQLRGMIANNNTIIYNLGREIADLNSKKRKLEEKVEKFNKLINNIGSAVGQLGTASSQASGAKGSFNSGFQAQGVVSSNISGNIDAAIGAISGVIGDLNSASAAASAKIRELQLEILNNKSQVKARTDKINALKYENSNYQSEINNIYMYM